VPEEKDYKVTDRRGFNPDGSSREAGSAPEQPPERDPGEALPEVDFPSFVLSMASGALVHLQGLDEEGHKAEPNLALARQAIDILAMLQQKTRGNLTGEEERLLDHVLYDLRMQFVEATKR